MVESPAGMKFVLVFLVVGFSAWRTYRRWESRIPREWRSQLWEELGVRRVSSAKQRRPATAVAWYQSVRARVALVLGVIFVLILWAKLYRG
jgi:hypothetical protein